MTCILGSQGRMKKMKSNRNLCIVRTILWIWKVIWKDNVDHDKYIYKHLRKGMEGRKEKADVNFFPHFLSHFPLTDECSHMNGRRRRNWTWNLRKGCSMETVWKQWVSRQYWRKQRSNSGWCEQTLILSLSCVFFLWGINCMLQDGALHRQWPSLYEKSREHRKEDKVHPKASSPTVAC